MRKESTMKTLGIIGGVGPETTVKVYQSVIASFRQNKKRYPAIVVYNLPFPFVLEEEAIIKGKNSHKMMPYLISGAKILEKSGANLGILPCNTLHKYINQIRNSVEIPFLSILEETALALKGMNVRNVGILATQTTVRDRLYDDVLLGYGINVFYPNKKDQNLVNKIIVSLLRDKINKKFSKTINRICDSFGKKGINCILLACTDLQLLKLTSNTTIIDSTEILIKAATRELMKSR